MVWSQRGNINPLRDQPDKRSLFKKEGLWSRKKAIHDTKTVTPLILKNKEQEAPDIFTQLIRWDCRIKVKLNSKFNLIVTYS